MVNTDSGTLGNQADDLHNKTIDLILTGEPGQAVQIWYRGDRESGEAPIVYTGKLDAEGSLTVAVPRAYLLVGFPVRRGGIPLELQREKGSSKTVDLAGDVDHAQVRGEFQLESE